MMKKEIACFTSSHGFGHAARTIAVLEKLHKHVPELHVKVLTSAPAILFQDLPMSWSYHRVETDVGLIQENAFTTDLYKTAEALDNFIPFSKELTKTCIQLCKSSSLILCDISPLGIHIGNELEIPSVLIENFTWDWIYSNLPGAEKLHHFIPFFQKLYSSATYRIQTEPLCNPVKCDLTCQPISRSGKTDPHIIGEILENSGRKIILVTMGGIPHDLPFITRLSDYKEYYFILAGQQKYSRHSENVLFLPFDTSFFHPDLINASSLVICKSGYSTIAECAQSDTSICCINRPNFAESDIIERYVQQQLGGFSLDYDLFNAGSWLDMLPKMLDTRKESTWENGAEEAAKFISTALLKLKTRTH